jgi:NitT/TauT family transport system substrate-binding protein
MRRERKGLGWLIIASVALHACSTREPAAAGAEPTGSKVTAKADAEQTLRLAYLANLTHAPAVFALERKLIANAIGSDVKLTSHVFHAGPEIVQALFSGDIDIAYVGPNPAINAYQKSGHAAVRIIAGATSGGAALVVDRAITGPEALRGKKLASPQLGNTQDVALRAWLRERGLKADLHGGGDVAILPQENAQALEAFRAHRIDGAWVPEPWASRLVLEGKGHVLVDEATLWPDGRYATTVVLARTEYLTAHREVVDRFLRAHVAAIAGLQDDPAGASRVVNAGLARITGKALGDDLLRTAWGRLAFTPDPLVATLARSAARAKDAGLLPDADIGGIADLGSLNGVLRQLGKPEVAP